MRDIVVVGSLNVDVSLRAERLPQSGETVQGDALVLGPGGKGLNQAIAAARLGGRVHLVGCAGTDRFADVALDALRDARVDDTYVQELSDVDTGTALIVVDRVSGQNQIAISPGANARVGATAVRDALSAFRASSVLLVQLEVPLDAVSAALEQAKSEHATTVLDPAPAPAQLDDALLRRVDVLTPNETEAEALSGVCVRDVESAATGPDLDHVRLAEGGEPPHRRTVDADWVAVLRGDQQQHLAVTRNRFKHDAAGCARRPVGQQPWRGVVAARARRHVQDGQAIRDRQYTGLAAPGGLGVEQVERSIGGRGLNHRPHNLRPRAACASLADGDSGGRGCI